MILIVYTTHYRKGSDKFERVAKTMEAEIRTRYSNEILVKGIFGKKELLEIFDSIKESEREIIGV